MIEPEQRTEVVAASAADDCEKSCRNVINSQLHVTLLALTSSFNRNNRDAFRV